MTRPQGAPLQPCGVFAAAARRQVLERPRALNWLRRVFAAAFGARAVRSALAER